MINIVYICIVIFILALGYCYIGSVHKINKADMAAKDAGNDIDTCLWDMNHNLGVVLKALQEKGIEPELPEDKSGLLALGMNPTLQQLVAQNAEERMKVVRPAMNSVLTSVLFSDRWKTFSRKPPEVLDFELIKTPPVNYEIFIKKNTLPS